MLHRFCFAEGKVRYSNRYLRSGDYRDTIERNAIARDEFATNRAGLFWSRLPARLNSEGSDNCIVNVIAFAPHDVVALDGNRPIRCASIRKHLKRLDRLNGPTETSAKSRRRIRISTQEGNSFTISKSASGARPSTVLRAWRRAHIAAASSPRSKPPSQAYTHSFGMSERHLILAEFPLVTKPLRLLLSSRPFIETYRWSPERGVRFTVIDKETGAIVRRAEAGPCFSFHHINAYEEDGAVVLDLVAFKDARIIDALYLASLRAGNALPEGLLTRIAIPLGEGPVTQNILSPLTTELPRINYRRLCRAPPPLCVEYLRGQRRLPRQSRQAGHRNRDPR